MGMGKDGRGWGQGETERAFCLSWGRVVSLVMDLLTLSSSPDSPRLSRGRPNGVPQAALEAPQPFHPMNLKPLQEGEVEQWPKDTVILLVRLWGPQWAGLEPEVLIRLGAGSEAPQEGLSGVAADVVPWPWLAGAAQHLPIKDLVTGARLGLGLERRGSWVLLEHIGLDQGGKATGP